MKENEAINVLNMIEAHGNLAVEDKAMSIKALEEVQQYRAIGTPEELQDMKNNYFEALSDWRQYRKIGTLEECRAAVEKQTAKKPLHKRNGHYCPICNNYFDSRDWKSKYCGLCGQKLDWSDEE